MARNDVCLWQSRGVGVAYLERTQQTLVHAHHGARIVEFSAVVGSAEQRNELSFREKFVAILNNLMCAANEIHIMLLQEARYDVRPKGEGDTTIVFTPASDVLIRI